MSCYCRGAGRSGGQPDADASDVGRSTTASAGRSRYTAPRRTSPPPPARPRAPLPHRRAAALRSATSAGASPEFGGPRRGAAFETERRECRPLGLGCFVALRACPRARPSSPSSTRGLRSRAQRPDTHATRARRARSRASRRVGAAAWWWGRGEPARAMEQQGALVD
eukprot:243630-Chlamydomonas_euryale.AAC.4